MLDQRSEIVKQQERKLETETNYRFFTQSNFLLYRKELYQMKEVNFRQIRAVYNEKTIRIYQAYSHPIAEAALKAGIFVTPPFKMDRMTWIKPSFLWMMYRAGWAEKIGQERILAIDITRDGFEWALDHSCLSHFESGIYNSHEEWLGVKKNAPVRIQWDPERDISLNKLGYRSIQIGLSREASKQYVNEWIMGLKEITPLCIKIRKTLKDKDITKAMKMLPKEEIYPLPDSISIKIGIQ